VNSFSLQSSFEKNVAAFQSSTNSKSAPFDARGIILLASCLNNSRDAQQKMNKVQKG